MTALFRDRIDAGKQLATALKNLITENALVLAIPRGGVVTGYQIAQEFDIQLDIVIPRKIGAPDNPELAIGAVAEDGAVILNDQLVKELQVSEDYIKEEAKRQKQEIKRRLQLYRGNAPYPIIENREVILVDDGIATGYTMKAALASIRKKGAKAVVVAIPVGPPSTINDLKKQADDVVCLHTPEFFFAIGEFYDDFTQTTDEQVKRILNQVLNKKIITKEV